MSDETGERVCLRTHFAEHVDWMPTTLCGTVHASAYALDPNEVTCPDCLAESKRIGEDGVRLIVKHAARGEAVTIHHTGLGCPIAVDADGGVVEWGAGDVTLSSPAGHRPTFVPGK